MEKQILIKTAEAWFEFTKSRTGQLDFAGTVADSLDEKELLESGYQKIASSSYFTPSSLHSFWKTCVPKCFFPSATAACRMWRRNPCRFFSMRRKRSSLTIPAARL